MATELVDASKLDTCCTAEANAIRAKTGSSSQIAYDWANSKGFADAIAAIPSGGGSLKYEIGNFTLATDTEGGGASDWVSHGLGIAPEAVIVWTDDYDSANPPTATINAGYIFTYRLIDMDQRLSSSISTPNGIILPFYISANEVLLRPFLPSSTTYVMSTLPTASQFPLTKMGGSQYLWRAGVHYHYFVSEAWW